METFLWSLLLAAVSAITFIAYKHPTSFRKKVAPAMLVLVLFAAIYTSGIFAGRVSAVSRSLTDEAHRLQGDQGLIPILATMLSQGSIWYERGLIICAVTFVYIVLLAFLPLILDIPIKESSKDGI